MFNDKCVLTIDDSDTVRAYLSNILAPLGTKIEGAATGQEGLEKCAQRHYDLILLDLLLPDMDGIEVLKRIREDNEDTTVVMLTGHGGIKSAIAAVQLGADGYLQKQEMTATGNDHVEFLYALERAIKHRDGLTTQKQLENVRADFYAMVTHDLRNPTSVILTATDTLLKGNPGPLTPLQHEFIFIVQSAAKKLVSLINNYIDFAMIDAGYLHLDFKEVDLCKLVEDSVQFTRLQAQAKNITISLDQLPDPVFASTDPERLMQVFDNLLSNAIKYTPKGGHIEVQMHVKDKEAVFCVSDTGECIKPEQLSVLFTKDHRVPGKNSRGIRGTGLELLIIKEIVEAHNGAIHVESKEPPKKGVTFTVTIPLKQKEISIPTTQASIKVPSPAMKQAPHSIPKTNADTQEKKKPENAHLNISADPEFLKLFLEESRTHISTLRKAFNSLYYTPQEWQLIKKAYIASHTLKGNAGVMQLSAIYELSAQMENMLNQVLKGSSTLTQANVNDLSKLLDRVVHALQTEQKKN